MSRPGRAADTNQVSRCTCAGSWHSKMTCACSSCKTWCCVSHKRYSRQARCSVARRESLCIHHKCMLGTLSRRRNCCIRHKRMLSTLQKRKACPFTASARAHLLDVPCHPKSDKMLVRRVQAQACLPTSAAVPKLNAVRAQRHCHRSLTRTCIQSVPRICIAAVNKKNDGIIDWSGLTFWVARIVPARIPRSMCKKKKKLQPLCGASGRHASRHKGNFFF